MPQRLGDVTEREHVAGGFVLGSGNHRLVVRLGQRELGVLRGDAGRVVEPQRRILAADLDVHRLLTVDNQGHVSQQAVDFFVGNNEVTDTHQAREEVPHAVAQLGHHVGVDLLARGEHIGQHFFGGELTGHTGVLRHVRLDTLTHWSVGPHTVHRGLQV